MRRVTKTFEYDEQGRIIKETQTIEDLSNNQQFPSPQYPTYPIYPTPIWYADPKVTLYKGV